MQSTPPLDVILFSIVSTLARNAFAIVDSVSYFAEDFVWSSGTYSGSVHSELLERKDWSTKSTENWRSINSSKIPHIKVLHHCSSLCALFVRLVLLSL